MTATFELVFDYKIIFRDNERLTKDEIINKIKNDYSFAVHFENMNRMNEIEDAEHDVFPEVKNIKITE